MTRVTMLAGPNGSGKTTLARYLIARGLIVGEFLNADDIAADLPGDRDAANRRAQVIVRERRSIALEEDRDHGWETVMSHSSHIEHLLEARERGCEVWTIYVATQDARVSLMRVGERVENGGHDVPEDKIVKRYRESLSRLPSALLASDYAIVYDNSDPDEPFKLLCEVRGDRMTLYFDYADMPAWFQATLIVLSRRDYINLG